MILAYSKTRRLQNVTHFFLVNLAIADSLVGIGIPLSVFVFYTFKESRFVCIAKFSLVGK